jgi:hypothetical protein
MRHQLVELRREQYTLRDSYQQTILGQEVATPCFVNDSPTLDVDIEILPLGVKNNKVLGGYIFRKWEEIIPGNFNEETLE